jgi:hypothetical protein
MTSVDTSHSVLEDRIFSLELALTNVGGALLAPDGWEDDQRLHQYLYDTVRRALHHSPFGEALAHREQQLHAREMEPHIRNLEPIASAMAAQQDESAAAAAAAAAAEAPAEGAAADLAPAEEPDAGAATPESGAPRDYGWPTQGPSQ